MKRVLIFVFALFATGHLLAQTQKPQAQKQGQAQGQAKEQPKGEVNPLILHFAKKYSIAVQWNDEDVAKSALYDLITESPQNDSLIYTLAYYYFQNQKYASSLLVTQELLKRSPKNLGYLEMAGASSEALGVLDRSIQNYESIYLLTSNTSVLYKIAFLQYDLKRFTEALNNAEILLAKPDIETIKVTFNDAENKPKEYTMKIAVMNLKGMINMEIGDKAAAKKAFDDILAVAPDFVPAKQSLAKLK